MNTAELIKIVEGLRRNPPFWVLEEEGHHYDLVMRNLNRVSEDNARGESCCGMASGLMLALFKKEKIDAAIVTVTSALENCTYHHYNAVTANGEDAILCDLTAAQFFTRPMDVLGEKPYFIGTRDELKSMVLKAQANTWRCIQDAYPQENFRSLWDVDLKAETDYSFGVSLRGFLRKQKICCLETESFYYPWETTWGDASRILFPQSLKNTFDRHARPFSLTTGTTPALEKLVDYRTKDKLTRLDTPKL